MQDKQELIAFDQTFNRILKAITPDDCPQELKSTIEWLKKVFEFNVPHGKRIRGLAVVSTYRLIASQLQKKVTDEELELARILGWTVEILQAYFLVVDDMMDQSITRRGQPCWYKQSYVGLMACNDAILIDQENYHILRLYFADKPYYGKLIDLMHEITRYTCYGQCMDTSSNPPNGKPQFDTYTQSRLESIYKYKTSYYTFVLPVRLAMYISLWDSPEDHKYAEEILIKMGILFQTQDDYLDCFGDPKVIGKVGTDIEEGKCCWPIVTAFKLCTQKQKEIIVNNYGIKDAAAVKRVKDVYNALDLISIYKNEEQIQYNAICKLIEDLDKRSKLNKSIFHEFLSKIYHRNK